MTSDLDEGEGGARGEVFVLVLHLEAQVLLDALLVKDLLLAFGAEQDPRGDGHRHRVLRLGLGRAESRTQHGQNT